MVLGVDTTAMLVAEVLGVIARVKVSKTLVVFVKVLFCRFLHLLAEALHGLARDFLMKSTWLHFIIPRELVHAIRLVN